MGGVDNNILYYESWRPSECETSKNKKQNMKKMKLGSKSSVPGEKRVEPKTRTTRVKMRYGDELAKFNIHTPDERYRTQSFPPKQIQHFLQSMLKKCLHHAAEELKMLALILHPFHSYL
jgi:hypothetical protein